MTKKFITGHEHTEGIVKKPIIMGTFSPIDIEYCSGKHWDRNPDPTEKWMYAKSFHEVKK